MSRNMKAVDKFIVCVCMFGIVVSLYTLYVEHRKENDHGYHALCDISEYVACSKVFTSKYGKGFGLTAMVFGEDSVFNQPNPVFAIVFYSNIIALCFLTAPFAVNVQLILTSLSLVGCVWLAYVLYFILHDFCVVCITMYCVQITIFISLLVKQQNAYRPVKVKQH